MRNIIAGLALTLLAAYAVQGAVTNTVPWSDSFENYSSGTLIVGTNGWAGQTSDAGMVTNLLSVTNYPEGGRSYPLPGTHTNVLALGAEVMNNVGCTSGGVVKVDLLVLPSWMDTLPTGSTSKQYSICISTNGRLTIWNRNRTANSNEWLELASSPVISTSAWCRLSITHDYSNKMYQVAVNEGAPLTDAKGWTVGGAQAGGSWFYMVQTNAVLSALVAEAAPAYLDDVVVVRRSLSWSRTNVFESVTNNGTIDNGTPLLVTLGADAFAGTLGDDLAAAGKVTVTGVPSNLVAVVQLVSTTQVAVTLTNVAAVHEAVNSVNLSIQFSDTAFTLGNAWDVLGCQTNVALVFSNTPSLSYSTNAFNESVTNDGSIDNSSPLVVTLTNGTFAGSVNDNLAADSGKLVVSNVPAGLTVEAMLLSATQVRVRLLGTATSNDVINDLSDLALIFQNGAFDSVPASSVFHASTNFSISYIDPSVLTYGTTSFTETVVNDGAVGGTTLTLANKLFASANGEDMVLSGKAEVTNLPAGLGLQIVRGASADSASVVFTGTATSNGAANSISNLEIRFLDTAFVGANAAGVANATRSDLQITFTDPRTLAYSGTVLTEVSAGGIDNRCPVTITLSGDLLTGVDGDDFVAASKISVAGLPSGLTAQITRDSSTRLSVRLLGNAIAHAASNSIHTVSFTFLNTAFSAGNAIYVGNYLTAGISVNFVDDTGYFNVTPYRESFESYGQGALLAGTNGWSADLPTAGIVTNDPAVTSNLLSYVTFLHQLPISATHTQVVLLRDTLQNEIHSEAFTNIFVDFMVTPTPVPEAPMSDPGQQYAFYVTTNGQLMLWQQTRGGGPSVNEWIMLTNAPAISTSQWVRFTIQHDYVHDMFQIRVNQGNPITDPRGWTAGGGQAGGAWFYMVQTNGYLTSFKVDGFGPGYIDDFTVLATLPETLLGPPGSVYLIR